MELYRHHADVCTVLTILASTAALILLLLLVVKCITAERCNKKVISESIEEEKPAPEKKNKKLLCPMCGWQHPIEQKVCRNPRCRVRF